MKQIRVILESKWIVDTLVEDEQVKPIIMAIREGMDNKEMSLVLSDTQVINPSKIIAFEVNEVKS